MNKKESKLFGKPEIVRTTRQVVAMLIGAQMSLAESYLGKPTKINRDELLGYEKALNWVLGQGNLETPDFPVDLYEEVLDINQIINQLKSAKSNSEKNDILCSYRIRELVNGEFGEWHLLEKSPWVLDSPICFALGIYEIERESKQ